MLTFYIIILAVSAWLLAWALLRIGGRVASVLGNPLMVPAGLVFLIVSVSFLMVASANSTLLVATVLLYLAQIISPANKPPLAQWGVPLVASILAVSTMTLPVIPHAPWIFIKTGAAAALYCFTTAAPLVPSAPKPFAIILLAGLAPLVLAPVLGAPSFIALDVAIILSALLGVLMAIRPGASMAVARAPFAIILGWLMVESLAYHGWIAAALSLAGVVGSTLYLRHHHVGDDVELPFHAA